MRGRTNLTLGVVIMMLIVMVMVMVMVIVMMMMMIMVMMKMIVLMMRALLRLRRGSNLPRWSHKVFEANLKLLFFKRSVYFRCPSPSTSTTNIRHI